MLDNTTIAYKKPSYDQVMLAISHWDTLGSMAGFFRTSNMPVVEAHIISAQAAIEHVWERNNFIWKTKKNARRKRH